MLGHLPEETTSFVGRQGELARLRAFLTSRRLITLTGPGGVGKTRVALRAAHEAAAGPDFPDGVCWVDLPTLDRARLLVPTVSRAVELADHTPRTPVDALCEWLADKRLLLVLDSCEHMAEACRDLVGDLLTTCRGLRVMATGRRPLDLASEQLLDVAPLPPGGTDALRLFTDRAFAAAPALDLSGPKGTTAAADICDRLEGIPLALELAAAHAGHNTLEDISTRLRSRLDVLDGSDHGHGHGPPHRHRTMRTTIGWSHELCRPADRLLWARLTVFRGPFDLESARAVCAGGPLPTDEVAPALERLAAQSVVERRGRRYRMLDLIREYGRQWLRDLGEEQAVTARHADHFLELTREADAGWTGPRQVAWFQWVREAHTDLCSALDLLLAARPDEALDLVGRMILFWSCCGHLHEVRGYLEQALAQPSTPGPHRTRALWALGVAVTLHGEYELAQELADRCVIAAQRDGDAEGLLGSAYLGGLTDLLAGRADSALRRADEALAAAPGPVFASGSRLRCHVIRVFALTARGDLDRAAVEAVELRAGCVALGERWTRSYLDYQLALIALLRGEPSTARSHARSMLESKRRIGDNFGIALGLDLLAAALAAEGHSERSARVYGTAQAFWRTVGHPQRGTPELAPIREQCERSARSGVGDERYERAFRLGAAADTRTALGSLLDAARDG
ncbi:ATP-binding protein [Streptomyces tsukubensis]|uniref:Regulator n=1 Tax=Streptomyces tsukubensis TaxID=83656 RepID=A0A1V4AGF1_9ACTN|nr:NB-ARC domain-containing protein [Streptomyces tsukubensis]OON82962.1 regulator [Streptomyces tsukubensis]QFR92313.1 regulator [Streptomyces tsukubensis]